MGQRSTREHGSIERLRSGPFRVVRDGKGPISGKCAKLTETCPTRDVAETPRMRPARRQRVRRRS